MVQRIVKKVSMYPKDIELLEKVSTTTGMNQSEVLRMLIELAYRDLKIRKEITQMSYDKKHEKYEARFTTSHNVQDDESKKAAPRMLRKEGAVDDPLKPSFYFTKGVPVRLEHIFTSKEYSTTEKERIYNRIINISDYARHHFKRYQK